MKTERMKIGLFAAQLVLPAVPGLYVILFRPGVSLLTPRMLIPSMLCINLLAILLGWRRLGWSRNERLDAAMLLVMFALFPWLEYRVLPVGAFEGNLWAQVGCYCAGQAIGYVSVVLAPDWLGRLRQRRYEERVLSGREKFRSRKEVLEQRAEAQEAQRRAKELRRAKKNKHPGHHMSGMFVFRTCAQAFSHGWQSACPSAHRFIGLPVRRLISPSVCQPVSSSVCQSSDSFARQPVSPPLRSQGARNYSPLPLYRERRMLSIQGFSMLRMPFWEISCASVSPIWRKSVERVVIPPARISLSGVSLYEMMPNSRPGIIC
jgi:hypothetical protein